MSNITFSLNSNDGLSLFYKNWPTENPKAVLALVHGLGEHIERYDHVAGFYNENGIALMGFDHRGHGKSEGKRGHSPDMDALYNDIDLLLQEATNRYPGIPVILYGHSMGGNLVLNYSLRKKTSIIGTIATAPWIDLTIQPPGIKVALGKLMNKIYPSLTQPNGLNVNHISTDSVEVKKYAEDPLVHNKVSASLALGLMDGASWLKEFRGEAPIPMLVMHGVADQITSAPASEAFAFKMGEQVTFKSWPGLYHEIHNERNRQEIFEFTLFWINKLLEA